VTPPDDRLVLTATAKFWHISRPSTATVALCGPWTYPPNGRRPKVDRVCRGCQQIYDRRQT
jgi:hypothetical protein